MATAIEQGRIGEGIELNRDFEPFMRERLGDAADLVTFLGDGEQSVDAHQDEAYYGSATRVSDVGRDRWSGTGRVEVVEGPNQIRVDGITWTLEGIKQGDSACWQALKELVQNQRVVVEPTSDSYAYVRLLNRTLINSKLIRLGVAEPDPDRAHRNRSRFLRYGREVQGQSEG